MLHPCGFQACPPQEGCGFFGMNGGGFLFSFSFSNFYFPSSVCPSCYPLFSVSSVLLSSGPSVLIPSQFLFLNFDFPISIFEFRFSIFRFLFSIFRQCRAQFPGGEVLEGPEAADQLGAC